MIRRPYIAAAPWFALALAGLLPAAALASQRIVLRNGFSIDCVSTQSVDPVHTRLFFATGGGYQDILTAEIASSETLADPPAPPLSPAAAVRDVRPSDATVATADPTPGELAQLLSAAGTAHDLDADLLAAVVKAESAGHTHAVSRTGARGLMQLMPGTAQAMGVHDAFRPAENITGGTAYLDSLLHRYRDNLALALAAYNAGPANVDRYRGVPPFRETRAYVARVIREFNRRKLAAPHVPAAAAIVATR